MSEEKERSRSESGSKGGSILDFAKPADQSEYIPVPASATKSDSDVRKKRNFKQMATMHEGESAFEGINNL